MCALDSPPLEWRETGKLSFFSFLDVYGGGSSSEDRNSKKYTGRGMVKQAGGKRGKESSGVSWAF